MERRRIRGLVSNRIFPGLLPLSLDGREEDRQAVTGELKVILYRYWEGVADPG